METKEILTTVKKIEIKTKRLVDGLITGNYHSIFKGQGIEFSEIREYRFGDDIRSIDWKVTARYNKPYIKEFIEERDLTVYFAFDISGSSLFGNLVSKKRKSIELIAGLMFGAMQNNDNIGLFLFTDSLEKFVPAKKGKKHVLKLIRELISYGPRSKRTNINLSLSYISKIIKKRSVLFVISDFYSDEFATPLKIMSKKHDLVAIRINDKREFEIPDVGLIDLEDEETGEQITVDTSDTEFIENYKKIMRRVKRKANASFRKNKIDVLDLNTDDPYDVSLRRFFEHRKHRVVF